jgi:hypothetical protein
MTSTTQITSNFSFNLLNSCTQRSLRSKYNIPPQRLDAQTIPSGYTVEQLSMRRKAEILKYSSNKQNSKTNNLTKYEKWAQLVRQPKVSSNEKNLFICSNDRKIKTPTSSCNVPGPIVYLYDDETVPLYNYVKNTNSYSSLPITLPLQPYDIKSDSNIILNNGTETTMCYVIMRNPKQHSYLINFSMPLTLYFNCNGLIPNKAYDLSFDIKPYINVYYSAHLICSNNIETLTSTMPLVDMVNIKTSFSKIISSLNTNTSYSFKYNMGNINFSNITLSAYTGYTYQITLKLVVIPSFTRNDSSQIKTESYSYYFVGN